MEFIHLEHTCSTNTYLKALEHSEEVDFLCVSADHQTAGRGTQGRVWLSEPGSAALCSISVIKPGRFEIMPALTIAIGLELAATLQKVLTCNVTVKWPNDLYIGKKKLAGILVETQLVQNGTKTQYILGCGLNVKQPQTASSSNISACSLSDILNYTPDVQQIRDLVFNAMINAYQQYVRYGFIYYKELWSYYGQQKNVWLQGDGDPEYADVESVACDGALIVRKEKGKLVRIYSTESLVRDYPNT